MDTDGDQKDQSKYRLIQVVEKCAEKVLKDLLHYEGLTVTNIDNIDKSLIQKFVVGDLDFLQLSVSSRNKSFLDILNILNAVVHKFYSQYEKNEGFAWFSLLLMSLSSSTPSLSNIDYNAEILSAIDNLMSMAKISKAQSKPFILREICLNEIQNSLSNLSEVSKGLCQELAVIVLEASCPQNSDVSPEYMKFWQKLTLFAAKYLQNASSTPFFILHSDQEGTLVQMKLIDDVNTKLNTLHLDALRCYLESVISELGGPLSSLRQLPQDLDPHNNECDEQTVSDRNTLLYFSELGKTHSSTDSDGADRITVTIGNRHLSCRDHLVEYRVRSSLINGFRLLNQKLLDQYKSTGCTTLTKKRKLVAEATSASSSGDIRVEESPVSLLKVQEENGPEGSSEGESVGDSAVVPVPVPTTTIAQKGRFFLATRRKAMDLNGIVVAKVPHSETFTVASLDLDTYLSAGSLDNTSGKRRRTPRVGDIVTHINEIDVTGYENSAVLEILCSAVVHSLSFCPAKEWIRESCSKTGVDATAETQPQHARPPPVLRDESSSSDSYSTVAKPLAPPPPAPAAAPSPPAPKTAGSSASKSNPVTGKPSLSTMGGSSSRPLPLPPTLTWADLKRSYGWYCIDGVGLTSYFYVKPNNTGKKMKKADIMRHCTLGVDYFASEQAAVYAFLKENPSLKQPLSLI